jgi:hypothetical protein
MKRVSIRVTKNGVFVVDAYDDGQDSADYHFTQEYAFNKLSQVVKFVKETYTPAAEVENGTGNPQEVF